ncbi:HAD family hydrolase [Inquilinus sp. CAU 1745]|uniref:HAD family hydrolase n=1 Tax=Inquilinus sp. CAU 1745 TaxID=3140369 RepID=UPI00325A4636
MAILMAARLVIFDCDGVLVDSEPIALACFRDALAGIGLDLTLDETTRRFLGRSAADCRRRIEDLTGRLLPKDFQERFHETLFDVLERELRPMVGIEQLLDGLDAPVAVASSSAPDRLRHTLKVAGLLNRFEGRLFSATMVPNGKPAPDLFLHAATVMGFDPADCIVVEDTRPGVEAARNAGMPCIGFLGGGHHALTGSPLEADWLARTAEDLAAILRDLLDVRVAARPAAKIAEDAAPA